jgi:hypothetical protein
VLVRVVTVLLCLLSGAWAQGLPEDINEALDPRTDQPRRLELVDRIGKTEGGLNLLVQSGLDGKLDTEVVHAVVGYLLDPKAERYLPHLTRICGLLAFEAHREKTLTRIQAIGEHPENGKKLRDELLRIAKGVDARDDPKLRGAAIDALGRVPLRAVLEEVVALGLRDAKVRAAALRHVQQLGFHSLQAAEQHLRKNKNDTVYDILRKNLAAATRKIERFRATQLAQLTTASGKDALAAMEDNDVETRLAASTRLKQLADKGEYKDVGAKEFASQVFDLFVAEQRSPDFHGASLANLCATLDVLARGGEKAPLWLAKERAEVVEALQPLATGDRRLSPEQLLSVGSAAVSLLHTAGEAAAPVLGAFARQFSQADARRSAIQNLGDFARRFEASRDYVGRLLAGMLPTEKDPAVRRQILATLNQRFVPAATALDPIRGYLQPDSAPNVAPALDDTEIRDCIGILGRVGSDPALALLRKVAREHPDLNVRRVAVEDGLLPWAARNGKAHVILKDLLDLAIGKDQPLDAREAVIDALGQKGTRNAHATLNVIVRTQGIDPSLQAAAVAAKLALAERLAVPPDARTIAPDDLQTAVRILEEERGAADLARIEKLARTIVEAGVAAKLPVGTARYRLVTLYLRHPEKEHDKKVLRELCEAAANGAKNDGLLAADEQALLYRYKKLLLEDETPDKRLANREAAMRCLGRIAELEKVDTKKAASLFMDAAALAIELKRKADADEYLNKAMGTNGVGGGLTARLKQLRGAADNLPG